MSNTKISQLPAVITVNAVADVAPIVSSGVTSKITPNQLVQSVLPSPGPIGSSTPSTGVFSALTLTSATGLQKAVTGVFSNAIAGTDYIAPGGALGTPSSGTLTNCTGLPIGTGVSGLAAGVATFLATPNSANLASAVTDETGSGALVFANSPTLITPNLGTPASGTLTNCSGLPLTGTTGTLAVSRGGTGAVTLTGLIKGNGTSAFTAAVSGTDYAPATSGTSILYGNGAGGFSNVTVGSGLQFTGGTLVSTSGGGSVTTVSVVSANGFAGTVANASSTPAITLSTSVTGLLKGNGTAIGAAVSGTDYAPATSGTSILKGNGSGGFSNAVSGTDYAPATSGSSILYGNGSGGFSPVTIGSNLTFSGGTLSAAGSTGVSSVTASSPLASSGGTTPNLTIQTASGSQSGALSSTDWTTFNNKGSGTVTSVGGTGTVNGLTLTGTVTSSGNLTLGGTLDLSSPPAIGGTTPAAGAFTSLSATRAVTLSPTIGGVTISPSNATTGVVTINPTAGGTIDNVAIGNTTQANGHFTALSATGTTTLQTSLTGLLKATSGVVSTATSGTDYAPATSGSSILYGNGSGGFSAVTVGTGLSFSAGTLSNSSAMTYPGAGIPNSTGSAWGTSYTTTGSGTVLALATSPTLVTPALGTPSSGTLSNCTVDGTNSVGYLNIPQNAETSNYTLVAGDSGKHIYNASGTSITYTIPANGSVAYAVGTAVTFVNMASTSLTIAITTDTLYLAGTGTTGSRTLAQYGVATAVKITSTSWIISGTGLT